MSKQDERQLSLRLGVPDDRRRKVTGQDLERPEAAEAQVHSLRDARRVREKNESARHFREIVKLARHF